MWDIGQNEIRKTDYIGLGFYLCLFTKFKFKRKTNWNPLGFMEMLISTVPADGDLNPLQKGKSVHWCSLHSYQSNKQANTK